jgi:SAM-dependent methyltransferase
VLPVHTFSKRQILRFALQKRAAGQLYDRGQARIEETFLGSIDRFCDIAVAFRNSRRVLDVGSGNGLLLAILKILGHDVQGVDFFDRSADDIYVRHAIPFAVCNVEADPLPFAPESMDAVSCCQALEHFTHSHLPAVVEMKRVLRSGGVIELDVPNAASFRNRSRLLRGKHITFDYREHYLLARPAVYKGREYYPERHNREFTKAELELLLREAGFRDIDVRFLKSRRYRTGLGRIRSAGTAIKDLIGPLRKSLIAFARK